MSCREMQKEWEEIREEIQEIIPELPAPATVEEIKEEIHVESHILIDLKKQESGRQLLKKKEIAACLMEAKTLVLERRRDGIAITLPFFTHSHHH